MASAKDSQEVIVFLTSFQQLRDWIDDDPTDLASLARDDLTLKHLCHKIHFAASSLSMNERRRRHLFAAPVDPVFISQYREYEERYARPIAGVLLEDIGLGTETGGPHGPNLELLWDNADEDAQAQTKAIEQVLDFAHFNIDQKHRDFADGLSDAVEDGLAAWDRLKKVTDFDLRAVFRRRALVPFILVPNHVAQRYGESERRSLYALLRQAHDAFIFGLFAAAIALMRAVMELTLRDHYLAQGEDLKDCIENCPNLPRGAPKLARRG
jgi:hypothetical protein